MDNLAIVFCLHGNEGYGLRVAKSLPLIPSFLGNKKALIKNKRYIDSDLNRSFPGNKSGNHEERIAYNFLKRINKYDIIIDLHSSSNKCPLFGIITQPNEEKIEIARKMGLKRLVIMPESFGKKKSLIDFVKLGISLEVGPHKRKENIFEARKKIENLIYGKNYSKYMEIFEVFDSIKKDDTNLKFNNFEYIKPGRIKDFGFTAVLVNEDSYGETLCLAAKKYNY